MAQRGCRAGGFWPTALQCSFLGLMQSIGCYPKALTPTRLLLLPALPKAAASPSHLCHARTSHASTTASPALFCSWCQPPTPQGSAGCWHSGSPSSGSGNCKPPTSVPQGRQNRHQCCLTTTTPACPRQAGPSTTREPQACRAWPCTAEHAAPAGAQRGFTCH